MGPNVQSGKTIWDQTSTHVKNGMGSNAHGINCPTIVKVLLKDQMFKPAFVYATYLSQSLKDFYETWLKYLALRPFAKI